MHNIIKSFILIPLIIILCGCYNYKEINEYAVVSAISIDKSEKNNKKYTVGIQIMNAKKDEESDTSSIAFYKMDGNTINECIQKMILNLPKELYLGHNEVILLSEELLKEESPLNYLDYFMRNSEVEKDSLVIIAKESKAYNILKIITPLETISSSNLKETIKVADDYKGTLASVTLDEFIDNLSNRKKDAILPSFKLSGDIKNGKKMDNIKESDPNTKIVLSNLGFFENKKLKGYLSNKEEEGYKMLSSKSNGTFLNIKCDKNNYASIRIIKSKSKEKLYFKNNKPHVNLTINTKAKLIEYNCKADFLKSKKMIKKLEKEANKQTEKIAYKALDKLYIKNKSDVLFITDKFYKRKFNDLKKYKTNENNIKSDVIFKISSNFKIDRIGLTVKSIKEVIKDE